MWLPARYYSLAPYYWLFLGFLFMIVGSYMGSQIERDFYFAGIGIGLACCAWGARVFIIRAKYRRSPASGESIPATEAEAEIELKDGA